ncbi:unnamed protein product [Boreogadus saida]
MCRPVGKGRGSNIGGAPSLEFHNHPNIRKMTPPHCWFHWTGPSGCRMVGRLPEALLTPSKLGKKVQQSLSIFNSEQRPTSWSVSKQRLVLTQGSITASNILSQILIGMSV